MLQVFMTYDDFLKDAQHNFLLLFWLWNHPSPLTGHSRVRLAPKRTLITPPTTTFRLVLFRSDVFLCDAAIVGVSVWKKKKPTAHIAYKTVIIETVITESNSVRCLTSQQNMCCLWIEAQLVGGGAPVGAHIIGARARNVYFSTTAPRYPGEGKRDALNQLQISGNTVKAA